MRNALVVIDMQNDFCLPNAILCVKGAMGCLPHVIEAVETARSFNIPIIWVIREHHPSGHDVERFRAHLYQNGEGATVEGSEGARLVDGLEASVDDFVVIKKRFSAFMNTPLDSILKRLGTERLVICGVQTPNCIRATAFDGIGLDYEQVTVLSDATASANHATQEGNLVDMRNVQIDTPTTAEWTAQLEKQAAEEAAAAAEEEAKAKQQEQTPVEDDNVAEEHGEEEEEEELNDGYEEEEELLNEEEEPVEVEAAA